VQTIVIIMSGKSISTS